MILQLFPESDLIQFLSKTFPFISSLLKSLLYSTTHYSETTTPTPPPPNPSPIMGFPFSDILIYFCVSLTTAIIASQTMLPYQKKLRRIFSAIKTHLEDWLLLIATTAWLLLVHWPYAICVLWRTAVTLWMKHWYGGSITTGLDSAGTLDHPESRQIIKSLKVLKGRVDISELRARVQATACKTDGNGNLVHPKFHQYLDTVGGFYVWKPALPLDICHHVRFVEGKTPSSPSIGEDELMEIVSHYSNQPFAPYRGLWEVLVIPRLHYKFEEGCGVGESEKFAILVRMSHGVGDGFSFLKLLMRDMAGGVEEERYIPPTPPPRPPSSWPQRILIFLYLFLKSPRAFYSQMRLKDENPLHNQRIRMSGEKVHVWSEPLDVEWLKRLKGEVRCGMSVVLLNSLTSALRNYMMSRFSLKEGELPETISSIIPVPAPNHPEDKLVNKFSIMMMPLEMRGSSSLERCREIEKTNKRMGKSVDCYMNLFLMDLVAVFCTAVSRFFIVNQQCTAVISNLPGPKKSIRIWGYPLEDTMFWLPNVGTSGISASFLSYGNKLRLGLAVDTGVIQDGKEGGAADLLAWMIEDLKLLAKAVNLPHDDESMFIRGTTPTTTCSSRSSECRLSTKDKDEVASEDFGYGGEPSDISSTASTDSGAEDEEEEEEEEAALLKDKNNESKVDANNSLRNRRNVDIGLSMKSL